MSKPDDEERREVAAKLRELADANRGLLGIERVQTVLYESQRVLGTLGLKSVAHVIERLADLIEPEPERTCRKLPPLNSGDVYMLTAKYASGLEYSETLAYARCSECGTHFCADFVYCPNCGAKVVDGR